MPNLWVIAVIGVIVPRRLLGGSEKRELLWRSTSAFWDALWLQQIARRYE